MIAIDTNVIIRLLTQDDKKQYDTSFKLFQEKEVFIPNTVILETEWVLRFAYEFNSQQISNALKKLFGLNNVHLSDEYLIAQVIEWYQKGLDFADAFHLALSQDKESFATFDEKFIRKANGLSNCSINKP